MVANILPADLYSLTLRMGSVGQNSFFSEHGYAAYQIEEDEECSNMIANCLPTNTPDREDGVNKLKIIFSEYGHVAYHI